MDCYRAFADEAATAATFSVITTEDLSRPGLAPFLKQPGLVLRLAELTACEIRHSSDGEFIPLALTWPFTLTRDWDGLPCIFTCVCSSVSASAYQSDVTRNGHGRRGADDGFSPPLVRPEWASGA